MSENDDIRNAEIRAEVNSIDPEQRYSEELRAETYIKLIGMRDRFEGGDLMALAEALQLCIGLYLLVPDWVRTAWLEACTRIKQYEVRSWDEVLGNRVPPGKHFAAIKRRHHLAAEVFTSVMMEMVESPATPIDGYLFEVIAEKYGIKKTLASDYFYDYRNDPINKDEVEMWKSILLKVPRK